MGLGRGSLKNIHDHNIHVYLHCSGLRFYNCPNTTSDALDALRNNSPTPAKEESKINKGSFCPVEVCEVRTRFLKEHSLLQHIPSLFRPLRSHVVQALQNMAIRVLGPDGNLRALVERVCGPLSTPNRVN